MKAVELLEPNEEKTVDALAEAMIRRPTPAEFAKMADARRRLALALGKLEEARGEIVSLADELGVSREVEQIADFVPGVFLDDLGAETAVDAYVGGQLMGALQDGFPPLLRALRRAVGADLESLRRVLKGELRGLGGPKRAALARLLGIPLAGS